MDVDPQFVNFALQNYRLKATSPAIDTGIDTTGLNLPKMDLDGNARIFGSAIDLGCYEYGSTPISIDKPEIQNTVISIYPNPATNQITVSAQDCRIESMTLFNQLGQQVKETKDLEINIGDLSAGLYILQVRTDKGSIARKIVKQ